MTKLSDKRRGEIYSAVANVVVVARVELAQRHPWNSVALEADALLHGIELEAGGAAVDAAMGDYESARARQHSERLKLR